MRLYHLLTVDAWRRAREQGAYRPPSLDAEGFIHLSTEVQWPGTRARFYADVPSLLLLVIDPTRVGAEVRYEDADGDRFPHLYGPLPLDAVVEVRAL
jgi:uncharacterized protein (DUF952 family)